MILVRMKSEFGTTEHKLDILTDMPIMVNDGIATITILGTQKLHFVPLKEIRCFVPIDNNPEIAGKQIAEQLLSGK